MSWPHFAAFRRLGRFRYLVLVPTSPMPGVSATTLVADRFSRNTENSMFDVRLRDIDTERAEARLAVGHAATLGIG